MNKTLATVLVLVIVVLGGYFLLKGPKAQAPEEVSQTEEETSQVQTSETASTEIEVSISPTVPVSGVVVYTNAGYQPSLLTVKKGAMVTFKNESSQAMWTASAMHPTHKVYPTTGGCLGSTFDACKGVQPGGSWTFEFDIAGAWGYHNHLNASHFGKVVVE